LFQTVTQLLALNFALTNQLLHTVVKFNKANILTLQFSKILLYFNHSFAPCSPTWYIIFTFSN